MLKVDLFLQGHEPPIPESNQVESGNLCPHIAEAISV